MARQVRNDVLSICDRLLKAVAEAKLKVDSEELFWIEATKVEALFGLGREAEAEKPKIDILDKERKRLGDDEGKWNGATLLWQLDELAKLLSQLDKLTKQLSQLDELAKPLPS